MTHPSAKHGAYRPWAVRTVVVRLSRKLTATYRLRSGRVLSRLLAAMLAGFSTLATALPEGASLVAGQANISTPNANAMVVTQGSDKAILNWQSFNIGTGQSMQFVQPGAASVALNRVTGAAPSSIYGSLSANGQVFLINPSGVMFAPGAQVHVGGLVASTLALSNEDFMAGRYTFSSSGNAGIVTNGGNIRAARGGYVLLAAPGVSNTGTIQADGGAVGLVAGSRVSIDTSGVGLVSFSVDAAAANAVASNSGVITANGGQVAVLASALGDAMATVVNQTGVIRATSATERNGMIVLSGGRSGVVHVAGTLDASGVATGQTGGTVQVLGDKVVLATGAAIDVSGHSGGGTALVGGDYQGTNASVQNASYTHMAAGSQIRADALESGNGGKVVLWANEATVFEGAITARGGSLSGNGGLVETSGKEFLRATGSVDASGVQGTGGVWLLDPRNVSIVNGASSGGTFVSPTYTPTADNAIADRNQLEAALNGGTSVNVVTGGTGTQAGNITVVDSITKSSGAAATLTLTAAGSIFVNNAISSTSNALDVNLSASAATTFGASGSLVTNGGNVAITGTGAKTLGSIDTTGGTGTGNLSVGSSGAVSQLGATSLAIKGTTGITAGATNNVTLNNAGNDFAGAVSVTTGLNVGITDANALILGTSTVSGTLGINTSGAITQTGALAVTGAATLAAGAGNDITLTNAANNFASVGITSGNNAALTDSNAIVLNGSTVATSLTVRAGGAITQSAAITAPTLNATTLINAGAAITLTNAGNEVDTVNLRARNLADSANVAGAIAYTDASAIGVAAAQSLSTVTLLAGGAISQTGAIVASTLTATTANAAGAAITLTNAGNNAATVNLQARDGTAAASGAANANAAIQYTDSNAVGVSGINSGTGSGGDVTLLAGGAITQTGAIKANTLTATTANATAGTGLITLTNSGNTASTLNLQARAGTVAAVGAANVASTIQYTGAAALGISGINSGTGAGGNVTLIAGGPITQSGAIKAGILTATTADAAGSAITLTDTANDAVTVNLQARTGTAAAPGLANASAAIQYTDSNVVGVSGINNGTGVGGDVTLIAGGAITQSGAIKAGTLSAKTLNDTPAAITLANAGNDAASIILQTRNSADSDRTAAAISYTDANAVVVGGINAGTGSAATGNLALVAAGAITQTGAVIVGGTTGITAGATNDVTLSNAANDFTGAVSIVSGRHVNINDANALVLGTITTTGAASSDGGNVQITAGGSVTTGTITTTGGTAGANSGGRNAGSVNITAGGALSVGAISAGGSAGNGATQTGGGGGAVTLTSTGGNLSVGAITTSGGNGVAGVASGGNAGTITLEAAGGTPTITLAGNLSAVGGNQFGGGTSGSGANIRVKQDALLNAAVTLDTRGGNAGVGTGGNIQFDGAINSNSTGGARALVLTGGTGDVTVSGAMGATSALASLGVTGNDITVANIGGAGAGVTVATTLTAATAGADAGEIRFTGTTYNANAQTYVATAGNTLQVNAGAATSFTSSADAITFGNAGNANGGTLVLADGSNLSVNTANGAISTFAGVRATSAETVSLNAGTSTLSVGQIGNAGEVASVALTAATSTLRGDITTADVAANNVTITGAVTLASGVTIDTNRTTNKGDITITGTSTGAGTALNLSGNAISTGAITTTGAANGDGGAVSITGTQTVGVGAITTTGGTATAGNAGRDAGAISISGAGVTLVAISASGSPGVTTGDRAGGAGAVVNLTSTNGISQTGALTASGGGGVNNGAGGAAGSITVSNTGAGAVSVGALTAGTGAAAGTGAGGVAGSISVSNSVSGANVTTGALTTTAGAKGEGGSISVSAAGAGVLSTGGAAITATGGVGINSAGANAGNITLSGGTVTLGASVLTAIGGAGNGASSAGGSGGAISVTSSAGGMSSSGVGAMTANGGAGGTGNAAGGAAGTISVTNSAGSTGTINLIGSGGLNARTGASAGTAAALAAGSITVNNNATAATATTLATLNTNGQANGNGGAVSVTTTGTLSVGTIASTGGAANASTAGRNAGVITASTGGAITALGNVNASGSAGNGASQPGGNAAAVSLTTVGGITAPAATVTATGGAGGTGNANGGNAAVITVANSGAGAISLGALAAQTGAAVGSGTGGTAGSISVSNTAGNLTTGTLTTTGGGNADGGNITLAAASGTVVAGTIAASGGAALGSSGGRSGGTINISGAALTLGASTITANGTNASTLGAGGSGGAITLSSTGAISSSGAISATGGAGAGANQAGGNGAAVSVSSTGGSVAVGSIATTGGNGVAGVAAGGNAGAITLDAAGAGLGITLASNLSAVGGTAAGGAAVGSGGAILVDAGTGTYTQNTNVDVSAGTGAITVVADSLAISTAANTGNNAFSTSGVLTLKPKTAGRAMSIAGSSAFDLSTLEMARFLGATGVTGPIVVGDTASTGVMTIGAAVNLAGKTLTLNAGSITDTGTQLITATNVTLHANGNIGSSGDRINVAATNLGVNTTAGGSAFVATGAINMGVGSAASNVAGTLDLLAGGAVTQTASTGNITAGTLKVQNSAANSPITLINSGNNAGTINLQATSAGAIQYTDVNGFDVAAVLTTGNATLSAGGVVTQSGAISASGLALTGAGGDHTLRHAGNAVTTLAANTGSIDYSQTGALTVGTVAGVVGVTTAVAAKIETTGAASDLTLANAVTSNGTGDAIVLKAGSSNAAGTSTGGKLVNSVGASGIVASAGRYLVYSGDPAATTEGVTGYNKRYNTSSSFTPGGSANMFLYRIAPTLTINTDNATRVYGDANPAFTGSPTTGLIDGDTDASVGVYRSTSAVFNTPVAAGPVTITPGATNNENYTLVLNNGLLTITRRSMPRVTGITAYNKVVDGNTSATLNTGGAGFPNLVAGDVIYAATATGNFDNSSVGTNKTVYITGISLGGAAADNYTLMDPTATTTASITDLSSFAGSFFQVPALPPVPPQRFSASGLTVADANALLESDPTASGGGPGTTVKVVREPTDQEVGLVTVTVASELVTAGRGFRFSLPSALLTGSTGGAVQVGASTLSGRPLPAWLRYDAQTQAFVAAGVPSGALPLQIRVSLGARSVLLTISQAQGDGSSPRRVITERGPMEPAYQPG